nr:G-protein coupled receptor GRL101-like isoform X2 [Ciona intestinalis]XP_026692381.1 G-protein coupled receptor GRL101-like isoform X2 [Ciona intestinalis]|eukprot:XP_026692380.1 G-protein coupled receptor GRL101-like isoform X2 [Ciona intestinalis]
MCCDRLCHHKQDVCPTTLLRNGNETYTNYVQNLNESMYRNHLEQVKALITRYAAERECWPENKCLNQTTCQSQYQQCENGQCVSFLSDCVMFWETQTYIHDNPNITCYPDELCFRNNCKTNYWMCDDGECVHEHVVCRGGNDCGDGSDEKYCSGNCFPPFRCQNDTCNLGYTACSNGECILQEQVCDTLIDCADGSDEVNCSGSCWPESACNSDLTCKSGYFGCDNGKCIDDSNVCDMRRNCDDGTDEIRDWHGFKCVLGKHFETCVLPQEQAFDTVVRCRDHADKCHTNGTCTCFTCLDQKLIISSKQQCDGIIDCYDMSDECFCFEETAAEKKCNSVCLHNNNNNSIQNSDSCACETGMFDCGDGNCLTTNLVCDGTPQCPNQIDEIDCATHYMSTMKMTACPGDVNNNSLIQAVMCDGRPECFDLSDECDGSCNVTAPFCNIRTMFNSRNGPFEFLCNTLILYFDVKAICDGKWSDCVPRIDSEELGCPARHYCQSGDSISIDKNLLCDGVSQCDDKSDETNCTDRFFCENGTPFSVPMSKKMDGIADCTDMSDECPKELDENVFSSRKDLLGSAIFRATTWIFGIAAIVGNSATFIYAAKILRNFKSLNPITKINYILLINLSVADGLMGIYLIILGAKGLQFSGNYCRFDKSWRTSSQCSSLGSLALVSSEATIFILAFLATLRLCSILNPLKTKRTSTKFPTICIGVAWVLSVFLGTIPRYPALSDYFSSAVWMPTKLTKFDTQNKTTMETFVQRLYVAQNTTQAPPASLSWLAMESYIDQNYPDVKIKGYFGYFSDNSVCLPKFFVSPGEPGWGYSVIIILFNFFMFVYICVAYLVISKATSSPTIRRHRSNQLQKMQMRVTRLVLTDFACWIPICIMSFLQLGGVEIPNQAYAFSAVILLPINSALNPLLYSDITYKKFKNFFASPKRRGKVVSVVQCRKSEQDRSSNEEDGAKASEQTEEQQF